MRSSMLAAAHLGWIESSGRNGQDRIARADTFECGDELAGCLHELVFGRLHSAVQPLACEELVLGSGQPQMIPSERACGR